MRGILSDVFPINLSVSCSHMEAGVGFLHRYLHITFISDWVILSPVSNTHTCTRSRSHPAVQAQKCIQESRWGFGLWKRCCQGDGFGPAVCKAAQSWGILKGCVWLACLHIWTWSVCTVNIIATEFSCRRSLGCRRRGMRWAQRVIDQSLSSSERSLTDPAVIKCLAFTGQSRRTAPLAWTLMFNFSYIFLYKTCKVRAWGC